VIVVRLSPEAIDELADAAGWYRERRPGLELELLAELERVLLLIGNAPARFPRLLDLQSDLVIRRALLPRFPYAVVFMEGEANVRVLAIAHTRRQPGYWLDRVVE
jgi:plasmid stabilization system protein ParE